jgi:hypothetical protein
MQHRAVIAVPSVKLICAHCLLWNSTTNLRRCTLHYNYRMCP